MTVHVGESCECVKSRPTGTVEEGTSVFLLANWKTKGEESRVLLWKVLMGFSSSSG